MDSHCQSSPRTIFVSLKAALQQAVCLFFIGLLPILPCPFLYASSLSPQQEHVRQEKKNLIGGFLGVTRFEDRKFFTYGIEYHRILVLPFGFSITLEGAPNNKEGNHEVEAIGVMTFNIFKNISVGIGPGVKFEEGNTNKILARVSLDYIFLLPSNIEITPNINYDFIKNGSDEVVLGITIGKQF
ncbi:hypothetical protein [Legionella spiritensis]|uniref:Outer membrane protein beta-barrel domain-containing protein n=1 Tax=Legionella spiritensis TaxID=452 RepID=A0A0W0YZF9_LEGSP|nr:hypothetical protein [Legionella spiritensis]KTD62046.1 hypothetical protein Lspi_1896 [Legionella spiritensis]SNV34518.1 Uncharacterised protein [Legionella spiritensis]